MEFLNSNTSQIEGLHHIYNEIFPNITDGFFVEVGAYDGYRWSNTLSLINNGWGGAFIEPIPRYADSCRKRYENNEKIKTYECCIGWENIKDKKVYLGGPCTTTLESMVELYSITDPDDTHNLNKYITGTNMRKAYSRSIVTFNTETEVTSTGISRTREEVRNLPLGQNIKQTGNGVGFQQIGLTNSIG